MLKKLIGRLKRNLSFKKNKISEVIDPESKYYTQLFTKDDRWNGIEPNEFEIERWKNIKQLLDSIDKNEITTILDFGCGRGWLTNFLGSFGKVTGIEPVADVVKYARQIYPHLHLKVGSLKAIEDYDYDLIVCSEVIEHISDNEKHSYFQSFFNHLKWNGYLLITTPRKEAQQEWIKYSVPGQPIEDWATEEQIEAHARKANFNVEKKIRYSEQPDANAPQIEVYQLWLFKKEK
jgi:cyclopropane fatty-acyl-phospholipid synthase-like methyltransferase